LLLTRGALPGAAALGGDVTIVMRYDLCGSFRWFCSRVKLHREAKPLETRGKYFIMQEMASCGFEQARCPW